MEMKLNIKRSLALLLVLPALAIGLAGCGDSDATVASKNLSTAADNFQVDRRITVINGVTDKYLMVIEGKCSIEVDDIKHKLNVTCKVNNGNDQNSYIKDFVGLSDNVTYLVEQTQPLGVDVYHYKVIFKPEAVIPSFDINTSGNPAK